jgi:hypothetical protein
MWFMALAEGMLSVELAKVEGDWLWRSGMTGNMLEIGFGCFGRLGLESAEGGMGNIAGDAEPIAWCGWLLEVRVDVKVVHNLAPFSFWSQDRWGNLLCDGWYPCHGTCGIEVSLCMGLSRALDHSLKLRLSGCMGGGVSLIESP